MFLIPVYSLHLTNTCNEPNRTITPAVDTCPSLTHKSTTKSQVRKLRIYLRCGAAHIIFRALLYVTQHTMGLEKAFIVLSSFKNANLHRNVGSTHNKIQSWALITASTTRINLLSYLGTSFLLTYAASLA
jgi:hypothetical protein